VWRRRYSFSRNFAGNSSSRPSFLLVSSLVRTKSRRPIERAGQEALSGVAVKELFASSESTRQPTAKPPGSRKGLSQKYDLKKNDIF
jgi:hypothetical protein